MDHREFGQERDRLQDCGRCLRPNRSSAGRLRRLALFIEESLDRGTQWARFEPNDDPLWAKIRGSVGDFLQKLFQQGGFQGPRRKRISLGVSVRMLILPGTEVGGRLERLKAGPSHRFLLGMGLLLARYLLLSLPFVPLHGVNHGDHDEEDQKGNRQSR